MRLTLLLAPLLPLSACSQYTVIKPPEEPPEEPPACDVELPAAAAVPPNPLCVPVEEPPGGFRPIVEWSTGRNQSCTALPVVGDLDKDGTPEVVANFGGLLPGARTDLVVLNGANGREKWRVRDVLGYGAAPAIADLDRDGLPEILGVVVKKTGLVGIGGEYALRAWDKDGNQLWESEKVDSVDFDYAAAPVVSDMDHDGSPEIVVGRVILNADGTTRGKGIHGRGSFGVPPIGQALSEGSLPAVADLDLDGVEEVIVGDARYAPDGTVLWHDNRQQDGIPAVVQLDDDPEGEVVFATSNKVRAQDTDGRVLWGPFEIQGGNITSPPAVADIDRDGQPEIIVAGGNTLWALNHDGTVLWEDAVQDLSGATGASIFDFEGDGIPEVVYIDEIQMIAYEGTTGRRKFYSDEHSSATMYDYPVIVDVDADDHAEILVCHDGFGVALTAFGDEDNSWRPARQVWNQHAYTVTNIADDLTVPSAPPASWQAHNTWHSALTTFVDAGGGELEGPFDVSAEILAYCETSCVADVVEVFARLVNLSPGDLPANTVSLSLYAVEGDLRTLIGTELVTTAVPSGTSDGIVTFLVPAALAVRADGFEAVADDLGGGVGVLAECAEANNTGVWLGSLCLAEDLEN
ncbi:MAG: hypothetical protein RLZZ383_2694 [Pseudomonadota bacterium]|jgi:hypothetical protein